MDRLKNFLSATLCILSVIWLVLLILFFVKTIDYRKNQIPNNERAYNVVILTGGKHRISKSIDFLNENNIKSVFISGVYPKTQQHHLFPRYKFKKSIPIILGKKARNTHENALEIKQWQQDTNIDEILLITSDYHMIRSLYEIRKNNKNLKIIPWVIKSEINFDFVINCLKEFHKTAAARLRKKFFNSQFSEIE